MRREAIEERLRALHIGANQLRAEITETEAALVTRRADLAATIGAIKECEYWLGQLGAEVTKLSDRKPA
jgi:EAL domain-containing protein (putative c-di-GMP-specific phosphodiesterase class I)